MAHFAKVVDGVVIQVIVAEPEFFDTFVDSSPGDWIQTSYNTYGGVHYKPNVVPREPSEDQTKALRKNYAGPGMVYDSERDAFYEPQPHPSWTLDEFTCFWHPPHEIPEDHGQLEEDGITLIYYVWDEEAYQADNTAGWTRLDFDSIPPASE